MRNPGTPTFPIPNLLWGELDGGLWHATSLRRIARIIADGEIRPGVDPVHRGSFSLSIGAVSLFDFGPTAVDDADQVPNIVGWFGNHQGSPTALWLEIDRTAVEAALIEAAAARAQWREHYGLNFIPGVEACHRGPIPVSAVLRMTMIARVKHEWFRWTDGLPSWSLQAIDQFEAEFPSRLEDERQASALKSARPGSRRTSTKMN